MESRMLYERLSGASTGEVSAIRVHTPLAPAGGAGDKVFPPTYAEGKYAFEERVINEQKVRAVLLDSVQSQANRLEDHLLAAFDRGECPIPVLSVTVKPYGRVTALDAPHRVYDAIFRDSLIGGIEFRKSELGRRASEATVANATGLYEICPTALIFGAWDSHGLNGGGLGTKFPRALTSEIIGLNAQPGVRTGGRIDPLMIKKNAAEIVLKPDGSWEIVSAASGEAGKKASERVRPSEIGHGNVAPSIMETGGVTITEGQQLAVLSFPQLRRLHFPDPQTGVRDQQRDVAGRAVLAALALYALALQQHEGFWLRSRCHLIPVEPGCFEFVGADAGGVEPFKLDMKTARDAFLLASERARQVGLTWREGLVELTPSPKLEELVARSRAAVGPAE